MFRWLLSTAASAPRANQHRLHQQRRRPGTRAGCPNCTARHILAWGSSTVTELAIRKPPQMLKCSHLARAVPGYLRVRQVPWLSVRRRNQSGLVALFGSEHPVEFNVLSGVSPESSVAVNGVDLRGLMTSSHQDSDQRRHSSGSRTRHIRRGSQSLGSNYRQTRAAEKTASCPKAGCSGSSSEAFPRSHRRHTSLPCRP